MNECMVHNLLMLFFTLGSSKMEVFYYENGLSTRFPERKQAIITLYYSPFYLAEKRVNQTDVKLLVQLCKPPGDRYRFCSH